MYRYTGRYTVALQYWRTPSRCGLPRRLSPVISTHLYLVAGGDMGLRRHLTLTHLTSLLEQASDVRIPLRRVPTYCFQCVFFLCEIRVIVQYSDAKLLGYASGHVLSIFYLFLPNICQNISLIWSGFLLTSRPIHLASGHFYWLKWDRHKALYAMML